MIFWFNRLFYPFFIPSCQSSSVTLSSMCLKFRGNSWQSTENNSKQGAADLPKSFISEVHHMQSDYMFLPSNLTASIMSRRSIDLWIKGLSLKRLCDCESRIADRDTSGACTLLWHLAQVTVRVVKPLRSFKMRKSVFWFLVASTAKCQHGPEWNRYGGICFCRRWQEISAVFTRPFAKLRKTLKLWGETPDAGVLFQFKTCNQSHFANSSQR